MAKKKKTTGKGTKFYSGTSKKKAAYRAKGTARKKGAIKKAKAARSLEDKRKRRAAKKNIKAVATREGQGAKAAKGDNIATWRKGIRDEQGLPNPNKAVISGLQGKIKEASKKPQK